MPELRLCKLPERASVRLKVSVPAELDRALRDYASLYAETYGQAAALDELLPAMLASFLEGDKAFARWRRERDRRAP